MGGYEHVFCRLEGVTRGGDNWGAQCPAHDDKMSSLSLKIDSSNGSLLVNCHAGCTFQEIAKALDIEPKEFFKPESRIKRMTEQTYDYRDEQGELLFQAVRRKPKDFRQRRPDGNGGWVWNLKDTRRVLYHLQELVENPDRAVFVVEGEKDVETLRSQGLLATCNPGGAGKWRDEYSQTLSGRIVAILPDNDSVGVKHAHEVAQNLKPLAAQVRVITLPELPEKGDVTDWFGSGGSSDELKVLYKATGIWDGGTATLQMASELVEDAPETPSDNNVGSTAVKTPECVREAERVVNGLEVILSKDGLKNSDPSAFLYMAYGMMEDIRNGKTIHS